VTWRLLSGAIALVCVMGWVFVSSAKEGQGLSPSLTATLSCRWLFPEGSQQ
jgi:hypothetical protein